MNKGVAKKAKATVGTAVAIGTALTIGLMTSDSPRSTTGGRIESLWAVGIIDGYDDPMWFVDTTGVKATEAEAILLEQIEIGKNCIASTSKTTVGGAGYTLTFFINKDAGSGWASAYPTIAQQTSISNAIKNSAKVDVKEMRNVPSHCGITLGWLGYVPNTFWDSKTSPVSFSDISSFNGCWIYTSLDGD